MGLFVLDRVEHYEDPRFMRHGVLDESRVVGGRLGKDFLKTLAIVVIADQQMARHFKVGEDIPHR